jgi:HEAT repeat protein
MALLRMPRDANAVLIEGLESGGDTVRATCAELLGLRSAISAVPALSAALERDPALEVRIRAARALGVIGAPSSVDALALAMRREQPVPLRAVATRALGAIGGVRTVGLLRDALDAPEHIIAINAARALAAAGDEGEQALRHAEQTGSGRRRDYAREGLSHIALRRIERQSA